MRFFMNRPAQQPPAQAVLPAVGPQMPPGLFHAHPAGPASLPPYAAPQVTPAAMAGQQLLAMLGRPQSSAQISQPPLPGMVGGMPYPMPQPQSSPNMAVLQGSSLSFSSDSLRGSQEIRSVPATPSSPSVASPLKKAVSATLESPPVAPQGVYLRGRNVSINRSEHKGRSKKPLEVNQITIYQQTDASFKLGSSLTVNNHFICYVVKRMSYLGFFSLFVLIVSNFVQIYSLLFAAHNIGRHFFLCFFFLVLTTRLV